jgi:hypothetical protein
VTSKKAISLKRGDKLLIRGSVRKIHESGKWIEVQFSNYSLDIPIKDILVDQSQSAAKEGE